MALKSLSAEDKMQRSVQYIYDEFPFFATIVAKMNFSENEILTQTMATDGVRLVWSRKFVDTLSIGETQFILLHEAGHIFLGHHLRQGDRHPRLSNVAADLALNSLIRQYRSRDFKQKMVIPGEGSFAGYPHDLSFEEYYAKITAPPEHEPDKETDEEQSEDEESQGEMAEQDNEQEDSDGDGAGDGTLGDDRDSREDEGDERRLSKKCDGESGVPDKCEEEDAGIVQSGLSAHAETLIAEFADLPGEVLPHPDADNPELLPALEEEWQISVAQGIQAAKACGNMPAWLKVAAEKVFGESQDWKLLLKEFLTKHCKGKPSYSHMSRRHAYRKDIVMPGKHSREAGPGAVIVDTSGSMSQPEMDAALREIEQVLIAYQKCKVTMMMCDTRLIESAEQVFDRWSFPLEMPVEWKGRGGTDLDPAFKSIAERSREFDWIVVVSDMEWAVSNAPNPGVPTLWLSTQRSERDLSSWSLPKFGKVIGPIV